MTVAQKPIPFEVRYPKGNIGRTDDYIKFTILKYKAPGFQGLPGKNESRVGFSLPTTDATIDDAIKSGQKIPQGSIILPIPKAISDSLGTSWGESEINALMAAGVKVADAAVSNKDAVGKVEQVFKTFEGEIQNETGREGFKTAALALGINSLVGGQGVSINSLVSRATGQIVNPNVELLFNGVQLRGPFSFSFDLMPRNWSEGDNIKKIIRKFKKEMLPRKTSNEFFVKSPNVFKIQYMRGKNPHPFLNKFKTCALTNMHVNYAGSGQYSSYHDATPLHMILDLSFMELSPIYSEDYDAIPIDKGVGY
jgi:hypothetical protein